MSRPYNAFISYRHHPLDSRVAGEIQRLLEGFRVPASLRKQSGAAKIDRLFRDKTELPITSDINDDILQALADSEFLIVICSTHTGESIWVEREIREFLRTHSQENILTVLADGEPQDVIPAILQTKTQQITDENGVTREVSIPVEPLSCDFRQYGTWKDRRTARREELPRLAAKLLHCAYDDLCQRQRQQQMRRLTITLSAAAVAMACLTGYFLWSNLQIRENYEQALTNQSMYLSRESLEQLDEGNRMAALELALAALPSEEMDRPWLPQAEYALSRATNAYVTPMKHDVTAVCELPHSSDIYEFTLSQNGERLYSRDASAIVSAWNTRNGQRLYTIANIDYVYAIRLACQDSVLVVVGYDGLYGYDSATGELLWRNDTDYTQISEHDEVVVSADGKYLYLQCDNPDRFASREEGIAPLIVYQADARTGAIAQTHFVPQPESCGDTGIYTMYTVSISPEGRYLAFFYLADSEENMYDRRVAVYDTVAGTTFSLPTLFDSVSKMAFTGEGELIVCGEALPVDGDETVHAICCVDAAAQEIRWAMEAPEKIYDSAQLLSVACDMEEGPVDAVLCASTSYWTLYDTSDGTMLGRREHPSAHAGTSVSGNTVRGVFRDGELVVTDLGATGYASKDLHLTDSIYQAMIVPAAEDRVVYAIRTYNSKSLLVYASNSHNGGWKESGTEETPNNLSDHQITPYGILASTYAGHYYMLDPDTMEVRWDYHAGEPGNEIWTTREGTVLSGRKAQEHTALALEEIGLTLERDAMLFCLRDSYNYDFNNDKTILARLELATGAVTARELPHSFWYRNLCAAENGTLLGILDEYNEEKCLLVMDRDGNILQEYGLPVSPEGSYMANTFAVSPDGTAVLLKDLGDDPASFVDVKREKGAVLDAVTEEITAVCWSRDQQRFAVVMEHRVCIYDDGGKLLQELPLPTQRPCSVYFYGEDMLLVPCEDGYLYRYQTPDGTLLGRCELGEVSHYSAFWEETPDGKILFRSYSTASVIDTNRWTLQAQVENCQLYLLEKDVFLTRGYSVARDGDSYGYFHRYTLDELTALAREQLGDFQLDEVARQEFGLDYGT